MKNLGKTCQVIAVYLNLQMGSAHNIRWSKSTFGQFSSLSHQFDSEKRKNNAKRAKRVTSNADSQPKCCFSIITGLI